MTSHMILFCLHYLGGSAREWAQVAERLGERFRVVSLDLPGFGDASESRGYSVAQMAETITSIISAEAPDRWMLAGHSMGAKVAAAVARRAEDGERRLDGLVGIVTIAGSPPSPEPMNEEDREKMLGWFSGDPETSRAQAKEYVSKNAGPDLHEDRAEAAVADALRMNRAAWIAWLESGSREDWSDRIGVLKTPALVIAGADDENLGPDAQRRLTVPHFANARFATIEAAKHLLPLERPQAVARLIAEHEAIVGYRALIASARVSRGTRDALEARTKADEPDNESTTLGTKALRTLRAVIDCVIPQHDAVTIDLAARIDRQLVLGTGDGWRFADLPADTDAYRMALETLDAASNERFGCDFAALDAERRASMLTEVYDGRLETTIDGESLPNRLDASQLRAWFEDARADAVKLYVAHPDTLARLGYSGIANGGDGMPKSGFVRIGFGEREPWEPIAFSDGPR